MDRAELERLDRESLVLRAQAAGVKRARILTRPELIDELLRLDPDVDPGQLRLTRGFFGRARDLLTKVVERGLHLPDAAERLVAVLAPPPDLPRPEPQAVPTVTLAEIYAAQGHKQRAIETLRRVLELEPDHVAARALLGALDAPDYVPPPPPLPPEPEVEPAVVGPEDAGDAEAADTVEGDEEDEGEPELEDAPESQAPMTEEPVTPLVVMPSRGDDECVAIPLEGGSFYVWWRVSPWTLRDLAARVPGAFGVRAVVVAPSWDGPSVEAFDDHCDPERGEHVLEGLPEGAIVRVAIGWHEGDAFVPIAHSQALELSRSTHTLVRWTLEGPLPVVVDDPRAASIVEALEGAARMTQAD